MTGKSGIKLGSGDGVKSVTVNFGIRGLKKWGGACDTSEALFFDITGFSGQICLAATTVQKQGFREFGICRGFRKRGGACDTSEALFFDITGFSGQICLAATTVQKQGFREFGVSVLGRSADLGMGRWRRGFRGFPTFLGFGD